MYDLVTWGYPNLNKMPKKQQSILAQRIEIIAIRILELIIDLRETDTRSNRRKILHEIQKFQIELLYLKLNQLEIKALKQFEKNLV